MSIDAAIATAVREEFTKNRDELVSLLSESISLFMKKITETSRYDVNSYITEQELSRMIGYSVGTLQKWRLYGKGPKYTKSEKAVRYRVGDVYEFMSKNMVNTTGEM